MKLCRFGCGKPALHVTKPSQRHPSGLPQCDVSQMRCPIVAQRRQAGNAATIRSKGSVIVRGIEYPSVNDAVQATGIPRQTIHYRAASKSNRFSNYAIPFSTIEHISRNREGPWFIEGKSYPTLREAAEAFECSISHARKLALK